VTAPRAGTLAIAEAQGVGRLPTYKHT